MATVKFFGLLRIQTGIAEAKAEGKTLKEVLYDIQRQYPSMTVKELKKKVIYVNGKDINQLKFFRTKII